MKSLIGLNRLLGIPNETATIELNISVLIWTLITAIYACCVEGLNKTCENQSVFCYSKGFKPLDIYSTAFTSDLTLCLEKCVADNECKMVA